MSTEVRQRNFSIFEKSFFLWWVKIFSRGEGEVSQDPPPWIDNMKYWVEGVAVLVLCLAGILGGDGEDGHDSMI